MFNPQDCEHKGVFLVTWDSHNAKLFALECSRCFKIISKRVGIKKVQELSQFLNVAEGSIKPEHAKPRNTDGYQKLRTAYWNYWREKNQEVLRQSNLSFFEQTNGVELDYQEYLEGPEWQRIRDKVLARANNVCEGCLEAPATQVHHATYDNIYDELAFQLLAVCRSCHEKVHKIVPKDEW